MLNKLSTWILLAGVTVIACKKTGNLPAESQSRILGYIVTNISEGNILGVIL